MSMCERGSILHGNKEIKVAQLHLTHGSCRMFPVCHCLCCTILRRVVIERLPHSLLDEDQDGRLSSPLVLCPQLRLSRRSMPFELCWA